MKYKCKTFLSILIIIVIVVSGCAVRRIPNPTSELKTPNINYKRLPHSNYSPGWENSAKQADNIAKAVLTVPGVKEAVVVVNNNNAYVGINIDIKENLDSTEKIQNLKKQIANIVRKTEGIITTVYVSADTDFLQRLTGISNSIRNGNISGNFKRELDELVKGIKPEK